MAVRLKLLMSWGFGLVVSVLRAQHLALGETRKRAAGCRGQGALGQLFRPRNISRCRVSHKIKRAGGELDRQPALRGDGRLIERQRTLET